MAQGIVGQYGPEWFPLIRDMLFCRLLPGYGPEPVLQAMSADRHAEPRDVAPAVRGPVSAVSSYSTGGCIVVDGGLTA